MGVIRQSLPRLFADIPGWQRAMFVAVALLSLLIYACSSDAPSGSPLASVKGDVPAWLAGSWAVTDSFYSCTPFGARVLWEYRNDSVGSGMDGLDSLYSYLFWLRFQEFGISTDIWDVQFNSCMAEFSDSEVVLDCSGIMDNQVRTCVASIDFGIRIRRETTGWSAAQIMHIVLEGYDCTGEYRKVLKWCYNLESFYLPPPGSEE